jgi:hypothetical protein
MIHRKRSRVVALLLLAAIGGTSCARRPAPAPRTGQDTEVVRRGSLEVTARLVEVPEGAIFRRELYDYATVLKYKVVAVHRGKVDGRTIYVAHYDPFKPRSQAADRRAEGIGGDLETFRAGQVHRMALEVPLDDHYMGGVVNKYFGQATDPIYWAVWTNLVSD